jgi:putative flippase GtrA
MLKKIDKAYESFINWLRKIFFKIFKPETALGKIIDKLISKEIISYLIFGVLTTLVNFVTYSLLIKLVFNGNPSDSQITISNGIAWVVAVIFAFFTNKLLVFESKSFEAKLFIKEFISFVGARVITGLMETFFPTWLIKLGLDQTIFGVKGLLAKIVVAIVVIILNYIFSKLIAFKNKSEKNN